MSSGRQEKDPLMFEMKEEEEKPIMAAEAPSNLEAGLTLDDMALCQASCLADPQTTALSALRIKQFRLFNDAVSDERFAPGHLYEDNDAGFQKTLLTYALDQWAQPEPDSQFVLLLVSYGAPLDAVDDATEVAPLHSLVRKGNAALLEAALCAAKSANKGCNLNVQDGEGLTPLHTALELLQDCDESSSAEILSMISHLLKNPGVEVNETDLRGGLTPLFYAANAGSRPAVELLLEHGADPDIEVEGTTLRQVIEDSIGKDFDFVAYADKVKQRPLKSRLFRCVETNDVNGLKRLAYFKSKDVAPDWNADNTAVTLLQLACIHGRDQVVAFLLGQEKCDPNKVTAGEGRTPLLIAAHHGYYKILDVMKKCPRVNFSSVERTSGKTVLHEVFLRDSVKQTEDMENASYAKCVKVLLAPGYKSHPKFDSQIARIINYQDDLDGNTALHLATMQSDQDLIKAFLRRGANMGVKNMRDRTAVQSILPDTLREFLDDDCIEYDGVITDERFKLTFRYDFLAPPILNEKQRPAPKTEEEAEQVEETRALPETEALWYLSTASKAHRALLKHPVISSFLWLKWQRIRTLFYTNLVLYLTFVVLLTSAIFLKFGGYSVQMNALPAVDDGLDEDNNGVQEFNNAHETSIYILTAMLAVVIGVLFLRELFQLLTSVKRYIFSPENLLELGILIMSCVVLFDFDSNVEFEMKRHLAALCILFSWTEFLILIGRHPRLSTNITMFTTVVKTFVKFLMWYGIIIVAFGMSFYIMMHTNHKGSEPNPDYPFFDTFWYALFKTFTMFVGELEFADIPFTANPISNLVFLAFIFLIVVVLMNLLNGLAVSDTGLIRDEAEVVGWSSRVELITYTESMLLGDPFYFLSNWPPLKLMRRIPSCAVCRFLYKFPRMREFLQKVSGGTKILLFYTCLPRKRATFFPNQKSRRSLLSYKKSLKVEDDNGSISRQGKEQRLAISNDVLDATKELILDRQRAEKADQEQQEVREALNVMSDRMLIMEELLLQLSTK